MHRITFATMLLGAAPVFAVAGEKMPLDQLPTVVGNAIKQRLPEGELLSAERETDDGKLKYEVKVKANGKRYEIEVSPDGKILEVEEERD